jgi:hypothetical protein
MRQSPVEHLASTADSASSARDEHCASQTALSGLRVLDLSAGAAGQYCAKFLAEGQHATSEIDVDVRVTKRYDIADTLYQRAMTHCELIDKALHRECDMGRTVDLGTLRRGSNTLHSVRTTRVIRCSRTSEANQLILHCLSSIGGSRRGKGTLCGGFDVSQPRSIKSVLKPNTGCTRVP